MLEYEEKMRASGHKFQLGTTGCNYDGGDVSCTIVHDMEYTGGREGEESLGLAAI